MPHTLERTTFETSRLLEFFSEKELTMQIGRGRRQWPLALLKELIDNALDACEIAGPPPSIAVRLDPDALTVADNGPGLPAARWSARSTTGAGSDKAHYVSPTRGQLGNALKCLWAAPYVVHGDAGYTVQPNPGMPCSGSWWTTTTPSMKTAKTRKTVGPLSEPYLSAG